MSRIVVLASFAAVACIALVTVLVYARLPDPMPVHFDLHGRADGWAARPLGAALLPALAFALAIGAAVARLPPMKLALASSSVFLVVIQALVLRASLDGTGTLGAGMAVLIGMFDVVVGLLMPRLRRNRWVGVRLPWTLASDESWARTHRFAGSVYFAGGLVTLAGAALLGAHANALAIVVLLAMTALVSAYSYRLDRGQKRSS